MTNNTAKTLRSADLPFDVTEEIVERVDRFVSEHERITGKRFRLVRSKMRLLIRHDRRRELIIRLRSAIEFGCPEEAVYLAVLEKAIEDLDYGCKNSTKGNTRWYDAKRAPGYFLSAVAYFESALFSVHCAILGLNETWVFEMVREYWRDIRDEYKPMRSVQNITFYRRLDN